MTRVTPKPVKTIEIRSFGAQHSQSMTVDTIQINFDNKACYKAIYAVGLQMCDGKRSIQRFVSDNVNGVEVELHEDDCLDMIIQSAGHQVTVFMEDIPDPRVKWITEKVMAGIVGAVGKKVGDKMYDVSGTGIKQYPSTLLTGGISRPRRNPCKILLADVRC